MPYHVIKTIKGKKYLYEQSTYRDGAHVRTISHYVGVVDPQTGELFDTESHHDHARPTDAAPKVAAILAENAPPKNPLTLQNFNSFTYQKADFRPLKNIKISLRALEVEYSKTLLRLHTFGIAPDDFPDFTFKTGADYGHKKAAFKNKIVITFPAKKTNRERVRTAYRRALHRAFIDTLERANPPELHPFKYAFDEAYRATQDALTRYLRHTNSRTTFARVLALKYFSRLNPVPMNRREHVPPEKLGVIEYGHRRGWKDEFAQIMEQIDRHGIHFLAARAQREIAQANAQIRAATENKKIAFRVFKRKKVIRRSLARIDANAALLTKLRLMHDHVVNTTK